MACTGDIIMVSQLTATVVGGVFRPDQPVPLPEQTRVRLTVEPIDAWSPEKGQAAWTAFKALAKDQPLHLGGKRCTREELYERR
jgi:hypothetical protein